MEKDKISFIEEKRLNKKACEVFENFIESGLVENPIKAKFLAFKEVKKQIKPKDIL